MPSEEPNRKSWVSCPRQNVSDRPGDVAHAFSVLCRAFEPDISESIVNSSPGQPTSSLPRRKKKKRPPRESAPDPSTSVIPPKSKLGIAHNAFRNRVVAAYLLRVNVNLDQITRQAQ